MQRKLSLERDLNQEIGIAQDLEKWMSLNRRTVKDQSQIIKTDQNHQFITDHGRKTVTDLNLENQNLNTGLHLGLRRVAATKNISLEVLQKNQCSLLVIRFLYP